MEITLIAALAQNRVIGKEGGLPWHLPGDLAFFKQQTLGKPLLVGRKTFESHGTLKGRLNLILTRDRTYAREGALVVRRVEEALAACENAGFTELMVGGGGEIYAQCLPFATRLLLTHVQEDVAGDALFPEVDYQAWRLVEEHIFEAGEKHPAFARRLYERL